MTSNSLAIILAESYFLTLLEPTPMNKKDNPDVSADTSSDISIIVPAHNEELNLELRIRYFCERQKQSMSTA